MLAPEIKNQLSQYLERLASDLELIATLDDSAHSHDLKMFLEEVAACSPRLHLRTDGDHSRTPSFAITQVGTAARIHFAGIPTGHEFTSLVLALLQVSGYPPKIDPKILATLDALSLQQKLHFEVFVSLSCHNCPEVVQAINLMASRNSAISATMIDGALFQEEAQQRTVLAVPTLFGNGTLIGQGRMSVEEILAKIDNQASSAINESIHNKEPFDVLVIGGGPAGASAAIYAARKGIRVGVVAERLGGQVLDTLSIENFISVQHTEGALFASALEAHMRQYDVDTINAQKAQRLIPADSPQALHRVVLESGAELSGKTLILATGARWREMQVPGEAQYKGKGVCFCPHCDGPLFKGKAVAVIGGGNSGVEAAIDLAGIVRQVTLIEFDTQLRADAILQKKLNSLSNVNIIVNALTTQVLGDGKQVTGIVYQDRATQNESTLSLSGVFVQIGLLPNTDWLKGVVELTPRGEIAVNAKGETNLAGINAAGDCTNTPYKQIIIACGEGAKAALSAFDYLIRH